MNLHKRALAQHLPGGAIVLARRWAGGALILVSFASRQLARRRNHSLLQFYCTDITLLTLKDPLAKGVKRWSDNKMTITYNEHNNCAKELTSRTGITISLKSLHGAVEKKFGLNALRYRDFYRTNI